MGISPIPNLTRRQVIAALGAASTSALAARAEPSLHRDIPAIVSGQVFETQSEGGGRTRRYDRGLANVMVSNGRDVAVTDAAGHWSLPARPDGQVFVIKPSGYTYLETSGVPVFSQTAAAGQDAVIFKLRRQLEPARFEVMLCADTQPSGPVEFDYVRRELLAAVRSTRAKFAIHHGDVSGDDTVMLGAHRDLVKETGLLWHHCPGNHDIDGLAARVGGDAFETWGQVFGPSHYAFQCAGATFFILNNVVYDRNAALAGAARPYRGGIGRDQLHFVKNVLAHTAPDQLIVVSMHIPLASYEHPDGPSDTTIDRAELLKLLSGHRHAVSFSGHAHATEHHYLSTGDQSGAEHHHHVLTAFCGSWWSGPASDNGIPNAESCDGSPRGYHVLSIDGNRYTSRFVPSGATAAPQFRAVVSNPDEIERAGVTPVRFTSAQLLVNVFDGGPRTRVFAEFGFGGVQHIELQRTAMADPHIQRLYDEHRHLLKPWVEATVSSHIWTAPLPPELTNSVQSCRIRVTDEYGNTYQSGQSVQMAA